MNTKTLVVIAGPTAVGKTSLALQLARYFDTEILSADSRQIYRELTIGSAKPSPKELKEIPHHFIDYCSVATPISAGEFGRIARGQLETLFERFAVVVAAGGSGLYIQSLIEGFDDMPEVDAQIREQLNALFETQGIQVLRDQLQEKDPEFFGQVDLNNPRRLLRALEVIHTTGKPYSQFRKKQPRKLPYQSTVIGLEKNKEVLYAAIDERVDQMMDAGLLEEVRSLVPYRDLSSLQTVGYSELFDFLEGKTSLEEAVDLIKRNSRRYAKRQYTWFRKKDDIHWFDPEDYSAILQFLENKLQ